MITFQCSLCRAVWWFPAFSTGFYQVVDFQCSLCRAVWWFVYGIPLIHHLWLLSVLPL